MNSTAYRRVRGAPLGWVPTWFMLVTGACFLAVAACSIQVRVATRPDVSKLESTLKVAESTESDVKTALGQPYGTGQERLPLTPAPRRVLTYYYEEGGVSDDRRIFLFVFIKNDRYDDGYLWFSSLE